MAPAIPALAVSPDGQYVAALRGGDVYTGGLGASRLTFRPVGGGFTSLSWDKNDNLWAAGSGGVVIVSATAKAVGAYSQVVIQVQGDACGSDLGDVTAVRVAPDGVRVALVFGGQQQALAFGAIVMPDQPAAAQSPAARECPAVAVRGLPRGGHLQGAVLVRRRGRHRAHRAWGRSHGVSSERRYPDDAHGQPPGISSIAAYFDDNGKTGGLVAGMDDDAMSVDVGLGGAWTPLNDKGQFPAYPG